MKRTQRDRVFAALPGPGEEPFSLEELQAAMLDLSEQQLYTVLSHLKKEGSVEHVRRPGRSNAFRRLGDGRATREYVPKEGVAYKEPTPAGPKNPVVAEALAQAQEKYGAVEFRQHIDAVEPVENAARTMMEASAWMTQLEARMHRLLQHNQELEAELARYRRVFAALNEHLDGLHEPHRPANNVVKLGEER